MRDRDAHALPLTPTAASEQQCNSFNEPHKPFRRTCVFRGIARTSVCLFL